MPGIKREDRPPIDHTVKDVLEHVKCDGDLNYAITKLILEYLPNPPRYVDYERMIGLLEVAKMELWRKRGAGYENQKYSENGDVY